MPLLLVAELYLLSSIKKEGACIVQKQGILSQGFYCSHQSSHNYEFFNGKGSFDQGFYCSHQSSHNYHFFNGKGRSAKGRSAARRPLVAPPPISWARAQRLY